MLPEITWAYGLVITAFAIVSWMIVAIELKLARIEESLPGGHSQAAARKQRRQNLDRLKATLTLDINHRYGNGIFHDDLDSDAKATDRSRSRLTGVFSGEIYGWPDDKFLAVKVGVVRVRDDKKLGRRVIDDKNPTSLFDVVGYMPIEWIADGPEVRLSNTEPKNADFYVRFNGKWGTPFERFSVCEVIKQEEGRVRLMEVVEYGALIRNSFGPIRRLFGAGRTFRR